MGEASSLVPPPVLLKGVSTWSPVSGAAGVTVGLELADAKLLRVPAPPAALAELSPKAMLAELSPKERLRGTTGL